MVGILILGGAFGIAGVLGLVFRTQFDAANMRLTPRWLKPADGGGVYRPDQQPWRVKMMSIGMSILILFGLGVVIAGVVHG